MQHFFYVFAIFCLVNTSYAVKPGTLAPVGNVDLRLAFQRPKSEFTAYITYGNRPGVEQAWICNTEQGCIVGYDCAVGVSIRVSSTTHTFRCDPPNQFGAAHE